MLVPQERGWACAALIWRRECPERDQVTTSHAHVTHTTNCFSMATAADQSLHEARSIDGVSVERRQVIYLSLGAFAALSLRWPQAFAATPWASDGDLSWDAAAA
jgi:hypothetical protein